MVGSLMEGQDRTLRRNLTENPSYQVLGQTSWPVTRLGNPLIFSPLKWEGWGESVQDFQREDREALTELVTLRGARWRDSVNKVESIE